jgi:hypothetical protein
MFISVSSAPLDLSNVVFTSVRMLSKGLRSGERRLCTRILTFGKRSGESKEIEMKEYRNDSCRRSYGCTRNTHQYRVCRHPLHGVSAPHIWRVSTPYRGCVSTPYCVSAPPVGVCQHALSRLCRHPLYGVSARCGDR